MTLNAAEDKPVVAADVVYVGPGCYREKLTCDVSGNAGNSIAYIADVTGEHTDDVGGIVRVTGSDNDQTIARDHCIEANGIDYRTFRGFAFDTTSSHLWDLDGSPDHWIIEDCWLVAPGNHPISISGDAQSNMTIRRSFIQTRFVDYGIEFNSAAGIQNSAHLVENCFFFGGGRGIAADDVGGITVRNCTFIGQDYSLRVNDALPVGYTAIVVNNCIFAFCNRGVAAINLGEIVEDYNTFFGNDTADRTNVNIGANSEVYPPLFITPMLHAGASQISGFKFPWWFGKLSEWSQIRAITGSNEPTEDLHGIARPVTASKNSWGPLQFADMERETGTTRGASTASLCLHDAGRHQIWVPVTNTSTTISVYVYREANYAGNNPQMIVKQPGQADDVTTDAAAASQWNLLTTTFTPAADPPYVVVELVSRNTNGANDEVFFDDLVVN